MSRSCSGRLPSAIQDLRRAGELNLPGKLGALGDDSVWAAFRDQLYRVEWVVYCKPPFGGPKGVFAYLGRYTHRGAISNHRILDFSAGSVTFAYRDYADGNQKKRLCVSGAEFLRRFLLHVLPRRFVRLRHYGLHASSNVGTKLVRAREILGGGAGVESAEPSVGSLPTAPATKKRQPRAEREPWWQTLFRHTGVDVRACPRCKTGRLVWHGLLGGCEPARWPPVAS